MKAYLGCVIRYVSLGFVAVAVWDNRMMYKKFSLLLSNAQPTEHLQFEGYEKSRKKRF